MAELLTTTHHKNANETPLKGRTIIICLDGTGDKFDADNSSIVHLQSCLKKSDPSQVTYYQSGIGTYDGGGLSNGVHAAFDMAVGSGLGVHVRDAYMFLMQTYRENDRICLFGFSRGAYTARCLAGMVHKVGLLPAHNTAQVPFAYQFYKDGTENGWKMSTDFKKTFCMNVNIHFVGVFDSVASVGFIPRKLPLSSTPLNKTSYFRHAMALDEHRSKFKVCRYQQKDHVRPDAGRDSIAELHEKADGHVRRFSANLGARSEPQTKGMATSTVTADTGVLYEDKDGKLGKLSGQAQDRQTDILEVWFAGCHADVGGGAVANEERHKLAQIPLRWMIRQCFACDTGILFNAHRLAEEGIDVQTLWPIYTPLDRPAIGPPPSLMEKYEDGTLAPIHRRSTALEPVNAEDPDGLYKIMIWDKTEEVMADHWVPEQVEDYFDAISPINDQLVVAKGWWVLEVWPIKVKIQHKESGEWIKKVGLNLGRFRAVEDEEPSLHWTVEQRMHATGYKVRIRKDKHAVWRIVA
ncbi:hypothetical protein LTR36_008068 [Oleoguttula mirabilis]|uniref:T6SS Phospholipase effector Tle1-like catalytic domain-containing protein n=1 Tax=Oleoguttula mirabilis TaxID=1507867 RepID=A0AAV9J8D8_9PEZI|nr:hypothetical protein LTR36_008068 [Oleoguttula mirabilis]